MTSRRQMSTLEMLRPSDHLFSASCVQMKNLAFNHAITNKI